MLKRISLFLLESRQKTSFCEQRVVRKCRGLIRAPRVNQHTTIFRDLEHPLSVLWYAYYESIYWPQWGRSKLSLSFQKHPTRFECHIRNEYDECCCGFLNSPIQLRHLSRYIYLDIHLSIHLYIYMHTKSNTGRKDGKA